MRLVLIWFGAFKNAGSTYAPGWVRRDVDRFPRAVAAGTDTALFTYPGAMPKPVLTVFSPHLLDADRRAFVRVLEHLADVDPDHTVVMVQVENEVGLLRDSRDRSPEAEAAWRGPVPQALIDHLVEHQGELRPELAELWARQGNRKSGTWSEVFGDDWQADEVFMAWGFASYCGALAAAGKAVKPLPMYANAWLGPQPGQPHAGDYPSGGPVGRVIDVWKAAAPSLDLVAPDIYVDDAKPVLRDYDRPDNPVFVPESRFAVGRMFWALGHHRALGFSVFGVDHARPDGQLGRACALLGEMEDVITAAQAEGRIAGVLLDDGESRVRLLAGRLRRRRPQRPRAARSDAARCRCRRTAAPASATQRDRRQSARSVAGRHAPLRPRDRRGRGPVPPRRPGRRAGLHAGAPTSSRSTPSRRAASSPAAGCRDAR